MSQGCLHIQFFKFVSQILVSCICVVSTSLTVGHLIIKSQKYYNERDKNNIGRTPADIQKPKNLMAYLNDILTHM